MITIAGLSLKHLYFNPITHFETSFKKRSFNEVYVANNSDGFLPFLSWLCAVAIRRQEIYTSRDSALIRENKYYPLKNVETH